ncbi:hypothetical protein Rhal01_01160 [Rubritalea halochordaticola]|uniref:TIR domain-containing protein n=1 Tax=Rubritalea halochordaticola TaxID=714537 RepID=A0ABP9V1N0_9BACT
MTTHSKNSPKKYWAFISYSSKDSKWGQWLHKRLESYPIPKEFQGIELFDGAVLGKNLRPIFRDRDELSGSSELGPAILTALKETRYLIVLCSKNSAKSEWVNKEIEDFKALGGDKNILALILDGEPNATTSHTIDSSEECFPPALRYPVEPLAGDLRKNGDGKERGFLKVLAGISQIGFDTLYRRHERNQRKKRRTLTAIALTVMASLASLSIYATQQKNVAEQQKQIANEQEAIAKANEQLANEQKQLALKKAEDERKALENSQHELYFASIASANSSVEQNDALATLRALSQAPEKFRNWEWDYLLKRTDFAPIEIPTNHIAILDTGPLKGSGLYQEALKALKDVSHKSQFAYSKDIRLRGYWGGRGGSILEISRSSWLPALSDYSTTSYGSIVHVWLSPDQSVALILSDTLRVRSHKIVTAPDDSPTSYAFYLLPVPKDETFVPISSPLTVEKALQKNDSYEQPHELDEPLRIIAHPNGLVHSYASFTYDSESFACFPSHYTHLAAPESTQPQLSNSEDRTIAAAYYSLPQNKRSGALKWLTEKRNPTHEDFPDAPLRKAIAVDWSSPEINVLSVDQGGKVSLTALTDISNSRSFYIEDKEAKEIWETSTLMPGAYDTGAVFSEDGAKILICPLTGDKVSLMDSKSLSVIKHISDGYVGDVDNKEPSYLCANDHTARPGSAEWRLSPSANYAYLSGYDAPAAEFFFELADLRSGKPISLINSGNIIAADWTQDESLFATYDARRQTIRLTNWPEQEPLQDYYNNDISQGDSLIQEIPTHPDRLMLGNTLLRKSDLRTICTFPQKVAIGPDAKWAVTQTSKLPEKSLTPGFKDQEFLRIRLVHMIPENLLADKVKAFQLQALSTDTSPDYPLTQFELIPDEAYEEASETTLEKIQQLRNQLRNEISANQSKAMETALKIVELTKQADGNTSKDLLAATYLLAINGRHDESIKLSKIASFFADDELLPLAWVALLNDQPEEALHLLYQSIASYAADNKPREENQFIYLAVAAALSNRNNQAAEAYQQLVQMDNKWEELDLDKSDKVEKKYLDALCRARELYLESLESQEQY